MDLKRQTSSEACVVRFSGAVGLENQRDGGGATASFHIVASPGNVYVVSSSSEELEESSSELSDPEEAEDSSPYCSAAIMEMSESTSIVGEERNALVCERYRRLEWF